jgi:hypothetical protein
MIAFWIATAYSAFTVAAPDSWQRHFLLAIRIDPNQRLAVWGFGLAAFFLYAGFRAWSEADAAGRGEPGDIEELRSELVELRQAVGRKITKKQHRQFLQASKAMNISGFWVNVFHSPFSTEAEAYCADLMELLQSAGIGSNGGHGTSTWQNLDGLGLIMIVHDPENPPEAARRIVKLLTDAEIKCIWARDNRTFRQGLSEFWLYVGKNPPDAED